MFLVMVLVIRSLVASLGEGRVIDLVPEIDLLQTGQIGRKVQELLEDVLFTELPAEGLLGGMGEHVSSDQCLRQQLFGGVYQILKVSQ